MNASRRARRFLRFLGLVTAIVALLVACGYLPTRRLAGDAGVAALLAGCAVGLAASLLGTVPLLVAPADRRAQAALGATLVRFLAAGLLAAVVALGSGLPTKPLLVWLGVSYAALLPVDAAFAARWSRDAGREET